MIGCDPIVAASKATLAAMREGRTYVALNTHGDADRRLRQNPDWQFPAGNCEAAIADAVGADHVGGFDADALAVQLLGDSIYTNPLMLGYAWQQGRVPLGARGADARDRAQRRAGREQQGGVRVGPPRRARPAGGEGAGPHRRR